ncbi:MAG: tetratricopeptide repeat protein [Thermodesulfobacteriota bacterium]|nr:tetratricopeptide repeat protein [Thermodesulfobacteriota bacterium]
MPSSTDNFSNPWAGFLLLATLIVVIYSNSFNSSWHFDDLGNIVQKSEIHINNLSFPALKNAATHRGHVNRPLSRLSFAFNWYFHNGDVVGYHVVNTLIHVLTAFFLFLTIINFFRTPGLRGLYEGDEYFIALLATVLWAANPIQTQAVTYIVQRMASMAAMFYILAMLCYVKARLSRHFLTTAMLSSACAIFFILGVASKENAVLLPLSLLLVELIFFKAIRRWVSNRKVFFWGGIAAIFVMFLAAVFLTKDIFSILDGYSKRPFTLSERVLTESRILVFYLTQLFYPVPTRLCLEHYFPLSTSSLLSPWTTLPAIGLILALIALAVFKIRQWLFFSFAVLFFFLNHLIESTIIPLELVFEHRNYLPSLFLFVPVAIGLKRLIYFYQDKKMMYAIIIGFTILLVIGFGMGTYVRNMAYKTDKLFWEDVKTKTPQFGRLYHNLAFVYYKMEGNDEKELALYKKALEGKIHRKKEECSSLYNIAEFYRKRKNWAKAEEYYLKTLAVRPGYEKARYNYAVTLVAKGEIDQAAIVLAPLIRELDDDNGLALNLQGEILLKRQRPEKALLYFRASLRNAPRYARTQFHVGKAFYSLQDYDKAEMFFGEFYSHNPRIINVLLWLVSTNLQAGDTDDAKKYTNVLLQFANEEGFRRGFALLSENGDMPVGDQKKLCNWFHQRMKEFMLTEHATLCLSGK